MVNLDIAIRTATSAFRTNYAERQNLKTQIDSGTRIFGNDLDGLTRARETTSLEHKASLLDDVLTQTQDTATAASRAVEYGEAVLDLAYEANDLLLQAQAETDTVQQQALYDRAINKLEQANAKIDAANYNGINLLNSASSLSINPTIGAGLSTLEINGANLSDFERLDYGPTVQLTESNWATSTNAGTTTIAQAGTDATNATYALVNDYGGMLSIDANTGEITANVYSPDSAGNWTYGYDFSNVAGATVGGSVTANDLSGNGHNATQGTTNLLPELTGTINGLQAMDFDGLAGDDGLATDNLIITNDGAINIGNQTEKSIAFTFVANDVSSRQVIYEQGGGTNGLSIMIENGNLYAGVYRNGGGSRFSYVEAGGLVAGETYSVVFQYDGSQATTGGDYTQMTVNGTTYAATNENNIATVSSHNGNISLGGIGDGARVVNAGAGTMGINEGGNNNRGFDGVIGEFNFYDDTLSAAELNGLSNYHRLKWEGLDIEVQVTDTDTGLVSTTNAVITAGGASAETDDTTVRSLDLSTFIAEVKSSLIIAQTTEQQVNSYFDTVEGAVYNLADTITDLSAADVTALEIEQEAADIRHELAYSSLGILSGFDNGGLTILQAFLSGSGNQTNLFNSNSSNSLFG